MNGFGASHSTLKHNRVLFSARGTSPHLFSNPIFHFSTLQRHILVVLLLATALMDFCAVTESSLEEEEEEEEEERRYGGISSNGLGGEMLFLFILLLWVLSHLSGYIVVLREQATHILLRLITGIVEKCSFQIAEKSCNYSFRYSFKLLPSYNSI